MRKHLLLLLFALFAVTFAFAQVTSSSMSGTIKDGKGETLPGATVRATHLPSGTTYAASTNKDGLFNIPGMRTGGPYRVEITFIGFQRSAFEGITLQLGQPYVLNATLSETGVELQAVNIQGKKNIATARLGANTNINSTQISTLPTFNRSINDFTRLSPQSNGNNGFAGRDNRMNN